MPNLCHESSLLWDVANNRFYDTHTFSPLPNEQLIPFKIRSNSGLYLVEYSLKTISPFSGQCSPGRLFSITFGAYNDEISIVIELFESLSSILTAQLTIEDKV